MPVILHLSRPRHRQSDTCLFKRFKPASSKMKPQDPGQIRDHSDAPAGRACSREASRNTPAAGCSRKFWRDSKAQIARRAVGTEQV